MKQRIYLDNAATTHPKPESVYEAASAAQRAGGSAGRGGHYYSRAASEVIFDAREKIAKFLGIAESERVIFTANATQALNVALFGLIQPGMTVVTTAVEHNAVVRPLHELERRDGVKILQAAVDENGRLNLDDFADKCRRADAVAVTHASNVSGIVFPLERLAEIAARHAVPLIVDASQTIGSEPIDCAALKIAALAGSGHKNLFGVQGCGLLAVGETARIKPLIFGGTGSLSESAAMPDYLPDALESGTQNTAAIAALAAGVDFITTIGQETILKRKHQLSDYLRSELPTINSVRIHGATVGEPRTNAVAFTIAGCDSSEAAWRLDEEFGIAARPGLHCSPWAHRTLGTLKTGTVRLSPGWFNTEVELEYLLAVVKKISMKKC